MAHGWVAAPKGAPSVLAVALSPRKQVAQCPTCCAQPARREWREDGAGSGDSDDEGAEALAGFFRLVVEMWGVSCGYRGRLRDAAKLGAEGERSGDGAERAHSA